MEPTVRARTAGFRAEATEQHRGWQQHGSNDAALAAMSPGRRAARDDIDRRLSEVGRKKNDSDNKFGGDVARHMSGAR